MNTFSYNKKDLRARLPKRIENSNKGTYGRVLVIGGSPCMSGAAYFAAKSAYRTGAGLVEILTHEKNRVILQTLIPEAILSVYNSKKINFKAIEASISKASVVIIGMGLSQSPSSLEILKFTLDKCNVPILIDADALNLIASNREMIKDVMSCNSSVIITPHLAEMSRLTGFEISEIASNIPHYAQEFSNQNHVICVLKDHNTAVAQPYSDKIYINKSGNNGMSTGGSGDVLDGIIGALVAQKLDPYDAATLGVYVHGLAGDIASKELSEYSVMASDIIDVLPQVFLKQKQ